MKKSLLFFFIWMVKISMAQYCGTPGTNICSPGGLSTPGITDYSTFPCVHNNVPYSGTIQFHLPTSYMYSNYNIIVDTVIIDSITNLPCGLCWQCNSPNFMYPGGGQGCIFISGTANDAKGAYQLNIYGRVFTPFGVLPGTFDNIGFQFFLNVVGPADPCTPINIQNLHTACASPPTDTACKFSVALGTSTPIDGCAFDSAMIVITQPTGPGYIYQFDFIGSDPSDTLAPFYDRVDSGTTTATCYSTDFYAYVSVTDSSGCMVYTFVNLVKAGPIALPLICYATADSSAANSKGLTFVFERDNWFNTVSTYSLYRQDNSYGDNTFIGAIPGNDPGYITDTLPLTINYIDSLGGYTNGINTYSLTTQTACGDTISSGFYSPFVLSVDTNSVGYPDIFWLNSNPVNYDEISIFSRYPGGNWKLRFATGNLNNNFWLDLNPDSTQMQYMAALSLTVDCDPNRAASHTAFSNFGSVNVNQALVANSSSTGIPVSSGANNINATIYPNPTGDKLNLQIGNAPKNGDFNFKIFDILGQSVLTQSIGTFQTYQIDVSLLTPGVYSLALYSATQPVVVKKFLKN